MSLEILTKRPEGMSMEEYKAIRKIQNYALRLRRKGQRVWASKKDGIGRTFKGKTKDLK